MIPQLKQALHHNTVKIIPGIVLGLFSAAATGGSFIFSKVIQQEMPTPAFVTWWFGLAGIFGLVSYRYAVRRELSPPAQLCGHTWLLLLSIALLNGIRGLTQHAAVLIGDPALVSFLGRFTTVDVLLLSVLLLGERLNRQSIVGSALVITGALLITYTSASVNDAVILLMSAAALSEAADIVVAKAAGRTAPLPLMVAIRGLGTASFAALVMLTTGQWTLPSAGVLPVLVIGAAIGPFGGFFARYLGLRYINAWTMGILIATQPLFTVLYSAVFLGGAPDAPSLLGGLILVAGVILAITASASLASHEA